MTDFKKEWFTKARVDYFSPFVNLWLACNSWYNFHYSLGQDRSHVNALKTDFTSKNKLFISFKNRFANGNSKDEKAFLSLLELLHFSLSQAEIKPPKFLPQKRLDFSSLLLDFNKNTDVNAYLDAVIKNALKKTGAFKAGMSGIVLSYEPDDPSKALVFSDNAEQVFAGLIEIIYQVRCMLIHGGLAPTPQNHEVVKYCYLVLFELMKDFCA